MSDDKLEGSGLEWAFNVQTMRIQKLRDALERIRKIQTSSELLIKLETEAAVAFDDGYEKSEVKP